MYCRKAAADTALHSLRDSFRWAAAGVACCIRRERNFRIHLVAACYALAMGIWMELTRVEWTLLSLCIGLVLSMELLNTALEAAVDLMGTGRHPLAKIAKDTAAGAVLAAAFISVVNGFLLFWKPDRLKALMVYLLQTPAAFAAAAAFTGAAIYFIFRQHKENVG